MLRQARFVVLESTSLNLRTTVLYCFVSYRIVSYGVAWYGIALHFFCVALDWIGLDWFGFGFDQMQVLQIGNEPMTHIYIKNFRCADQLNKLEPNPLTPPWAS